MSDEVREERFPRVIIGRADGDAIMHDDPCRLRQDHGQ